MTLDPLPGQKTNILAGLEVLVQAAGATGLITPEQTSLASQIIAGLISITLALKAWRNRRKG